MIQTLSWLSADASRYRIEFSCVWCNIEQQNVEAKDIKSVAMNKMVGKV